MIFMLFIFHKVNFMDNIFMIFYVLWTLIVFLKSRVFTLFYVFYVV